MATGDINDLLNTIAIKLPDNDTGEISPADVRTVDSAIVTYNLNKAESNPQEVEGPVDFKTRPTHLGADILTVDDLEIVPVSYCDYSFEPSPYLKLTPTPQIITQWDADITPVGISVDAGGVFTIGFDGVYAIDISRTYINTDSNPTLIVNVTINIEADFGAGFSSIFTRTLPLSSATANDEPAILSFTSTAKRELPAGTKIRVSYSAEDDGLEPNETFLLSSGVDANLIHNLPGA